VPEARQGK